MKTEQAFSAMHPIMGRCIQTLREEGLLDLESRKGKAPGGYNYPLYESGAPFIFMNAAGTMRDLTTMVHEAGHAVHTFLSADLALNAYKNVPSEVAELASMSMELISMDKWDLFFTNSSDCSRARKQQLEDALGTLPWVATIDKFQHWLYTHPEHTREARQDAWIRIHQEFGAGNADWSSLEDAQGYLWHKQLHIFEVPFYYIEYGMAQLGAIGLWKNYLENGQSAIEQYLDALRLGYTRTINEIYEIAGVPFNFHSNYIAQLVQFIKIRYDEI